MLGHDRQKRILILGGGFGGLYAALQLEKTLARNPDVEVTLVSRDNFFLFTPMLHEVAASDLDPTDIVSPIRKLLRRVKFFDGNVESIDLRRKRVVVSHGIGTAHPHELEYNHLVIALGSTTNFFNLSGLQERALTMKTLGDAIYLRNRMIQHLEEVEFRLNTKVTGISERGVELGDGTIIKTNTLVWTAGTSPNPLLETLPCRKERGRLVVSSYMEVPDWPGVWALGDCAAIRDVGLLFFESGRGKLFYKLEELGQYFVQLGIPFPHLNALVTASIEFFGGVCLILGLATRIVSVPLAFIMLVAILTAQLDKAKTLGDFLYLPEVLLLVLFVWLVFSGPGKVSMDQILARKLGIDGDKI